jgi:hypothetical protein
MNIMGENVSKWLVFDDSLTDGVKLFLIIWSEVQDYRLQQGAFKGFLPNGQD